MKAIIPAAGHGTRFLPVTKAVPKEMLPIGAKPALELIVEEARRAGATEIVMVISEGKELIRRYFEDQPDIRFVYQREQRGLGHAVLQAEGEVRSKSEEVRSEAVLILLGDALVIGCDAASEMVALSRTHGGAGVIGCEHVPAEKISRYGILKVEDGRITDLVEKPKAEDAPSDLAIAGRYLLPVEIFDYLADQTAGVGGEIQLTDAIRRMVRAGADVIAYPYPGKRQDIGNPQGYFRALEAFYANR